MDTLRYVELARTHGTLQPEAFTSRISVNIVTNFTDDLFKKLLIGMSLSEDIYPDVWVSPYKQYHFMLKDRSSELHARDAAVTFMLFDLNPYLESEFASPEHCADVLADVEEFSARSSGIVVIGTFLLPYEGRHGLKANEGRLWDRIEGYNKDLRELARRRSNVYVLDTNAIAHGLGFSHHRDLRNLYAFDMPFAEAFTARICAKWLAYLRARLGRAKKCIVLDLDNVLWGGVLGEAGPLGIEIGADYPGNAFRSFQQKLLDFYDRGIILAVNSKNNLADVKEAFAKNQNMVLREGHFAALYANWESKADNLVAIANELNIDLGSMVFLDDDPVNRDVVRARLPQVLVPDFSLPPEEYTHALLSLDVFDPLSISAEDKERNRMYAEERERKKAMAGAHDMDDYLRGLNITMRVCRNDAAAVPRASQLTLKTNQFNLTTRRYAEHDIEAFHADGSLVYTAEVADRYGRYGITNVAIVRFADERTAFIDTFLMSCRVMGRGIEFALMDHIIADMRKRGVVTMRAEFIATPKNSPAKDFLPAAGYAEVKRAGDTVSHELEMASYAGHAALFPKDAVRVEEGERHL